LKFEKKLVMKNIHSLFLLIAFASVSIVAQAQNQEPKSDKWLRAAYASLQEERFELKFETERAEAFSNVLLKAYRELLPLPKYFPQTIVANDKAILQQLITQLNQLRINPPTWDEIMSFEEQKIALENAPPTAPVFAGSAEAQKYLDKKMKNTVKHYSSPNATIIEQTISDDPHAGN
jgi:hypothetical protein